MSMDIIIWAACTLNIPTDLPQPEKWLSHKLEDMSYWSFQSPGSEWQLVFENPKGYSVPKPILEVYPNIKVGYALTLEPMGAPKDGYKFLNETISAIAKKCSGAVLQDFEGLKEIDADEKVKKS